MQRIVTPAAVEPVCRQARKRGAPFFAVVVIWLVLGSATLPSQIVDSNSPSTNQITGPAATGSPGTNHPPTFYPGGQIQAVRESCIDGRRRICGRVVQIIPGGLVVDSGYLGLLKPELSRSWVAHSNVVVTKSEDYVEENTPGAVAKGLVFIADVPKRPPVKLYDYVILQGYPEGMKTYQSVGTLSRTVRKFSAVLVKAVDANLAAGAGAGTNAVIVK